MNFGFMSDILRNLTRLALVRVGAIGLIFLTQTWIIKIFGLQEYGKFVYFISLTSLVAVLSKGGLDVLLLKRVAAAVANSESFENIQKIRRIYLGRGILISAAVSTAVIFGMAQYSLGQGLDGGTAWILFYIASISTVAFQVLLGFERGRGNLVTADLFDQVVRTCMMLACVGVLMSFAVDSASKLQAAYAISFSGTAYVVYRTYRPGNHSSLLSGIRKNSVTDANSYTLRQHATFTASGLLTFVFFQMDGLILSHHVSSAELGAYNMACNLARFVIFIPMIILVIFQSKVAVAFVNDNRSNLAIYFFQSIILSLLGASLTAIIFFVCGRYVLEMIDPAVGIAFPALKVLLLAYFINSVLMVIGAFAVLSKNYIKLVVAQAIGAIATAISYIMLASNYGQVGVAWSVVVGLSVVVLAAGFLFRFAIIDGIDLLRA